MKTPQGIMPALLVLSFMASIVMSLLRDSPEFNIDLPSPTGRETYAQVMPASIGGQSMTIHPLPDDAHRFHGIRAEYGIGAAIEIGQAQSQQDLDSHVDTQLRQRLAAYASRHSGKIEGRWRLSGSGEQGRFFGWQNDTWLFVIEASDQQLFDEIVEKFAFIDRH